MDAPKARIRELDVLRGLCAIAVVLHHYTAMYDSQHGTPSRLGFDFAIGSYGVNFFFVISGFVIIMTLKNCTRSLDFIVSRFSRIFPAYWAAVLITTALLYLLGDATPPSLKIMLVNLTMFQRFLGSPHVDAVYWTLNVEMSFYIWMLLIFKFNLIGKLHSLMMAALSVQMLAAILQHSGMTPFSQGLKVVFLLEYVHLFCIGIIFYEIWTGGFRRKHLLFFIWALLNQAVIPYRSFPWIAPAYYGIGVLIIIYAVMALVVSSKMNWIVSPLTLFLGAISYPLYLLHDKIGTTWMQHFSERGWSNWMAFFTALGFVVLLSALLTYTIERPAMKKIRRLYSNWSAIRRFPADLTAPSFTEKPPQN